MKSKKMWWLNEESQQVLNRGYLLKGETAQDAIERIVTRRVHITMVNLKRNSEN